MIPIALLPKMEMGPRIVCGVLGAIVAGMLNLVFRRARWRWHQFTVAIAVAPIAILLGSCSGWCSGGNRTEYVFTGALVGIVCIRGSVCGRRLPDFAVRAWV